MANNSDKTLSGDDDNVPPNPPTFPEGGLKAWMAVLSCWCIMFNTFGYVNAFGIYEAYYGQTLLRDQSDSNIGWIGSLQIFFMLSAGLVSGPLMDRYGPRIILIPCSLLFVLSVMLTSLCKEYYQFILAQGILGGLTNGLTFTPSVTAVNQYFFHRRALAMGIATSGSTLAGIIFPIALNRMLNQTDLGFGWSVRVLGFLILFLSIVACATVTSNVPKRRTGPPFLLEAWKQPAYTFQILGLFPVVWGIFVPFYFIPGYAQSISISIDDSFYLIAILNAGSLVGRLITGAIANQIGRFNTMSGASVVCGILILCWLRITSHGGMIVFSVIFGFFSGTIISLITATIAMTAPQPNQIGSYMGMGLGVLGLAGLTGTPITGAMVNSYGNYDAARIFGGVACLLGAGVIFCARVAFAGLKLVA